MKEAIQHLKQSDPVLSGIIDRVGDYGIEFRDPDFETLVKSIVYQQLSGRVASVIFGRVVKAAGGKLTPESILKLRPARMRALGLSGQKTAYIRDLARHTRDGRVDFAELLDLPDEAVIERLTEVKGIGVWTAHMFLIFALRRTDVLPWGTWGFARPSARRTVLPSCRSRPRWRRWRRGGGPTARWRAGTCGAAWNPTPTCEGV